MKWERDKKLHALVGFGISFLLALIEIKFTEIPVIFAALSGFAAAAIAGWVKEYWYDSKRPDRHTVDRKDFYATALGGAVGTVMVIVLDTLFKVGV